MPDREDGPAGGPGRLPGEALARLLAGTRRRPQPPGPGPAPAAAPAPVEAAAARAVGPGPARVAPINATGTVFDPACAPPPLAPAAIEAVARAAAGRADPDPAAIEARLARLAGAARALVLPDLPQALTLTLAALAGPGGAVVVPRADLFALEDGIRIEALIRASGAKLIEAGAVNAVDATDIRAATTPATRVLLRLHCHAPALGREPDTIFPGGPTLAELAPIARLQGAVVVHAFGGGALASDRIEPSIGALLRSGADLVLAPGDRLIGGPRAGLVAGGADAIAPVARLAAATRPGCDRLVLAALDATLALHERPHPDAAAPADLASIPLHRMLAQDRPLLEERARRLAGLLPGAAPRIVPASARIGGGVEPGRFRPSVALLLECGTAAEARRIAAALARHAVPVACRPPEGDPLLRLDLYAVRDEELGALGGAIREVLDRDA